MAAYMPVTLFIPQELIRRVSDYSFAYGYCKVLKNVVVLNYITVSSTKNDNCFKLCSRSNSEIYGNGNRSLKFLGLIYSSETEKHCETNDIENSTAHVRIKLRINELTRSFHLEKIIIKDVFITDVQVVIYDGYSIIKSQLLPLKKQHPEGLEDSFVSFLISSCADFVELVRNETDCKLLKVEDAYSLEEDLLSQWFSFFLVFMSRIITMVYHCASILVVRCPQLMGNIMLSTVIGQQFHQRYLQFSFLYLDQVEKKPLNLKTKNLICAIFLDVLCGCFIMQYFLKADVSNGMLESTMSSTNDLVHCLTNLINWLMGAPAGLKLNIPLNNALGKFFLYHIYLWESYMMVVQPAFSFIFKMSTVISIFGITFILSLLNDLISFATIHIYCFYGYAARLYGYQVKSLAALWRLFRGKKWNPLRQRIDSYTYDVHQLYLGTLIFTVLLFLLPTVMVYYFVFTCLRILVLGLQGIISRIINILTICPVYSTFSRILNSAETTGEVYFSVFNTEGALTFSMKASQISLKDVIQLTVPKLKKYHELLTWKEIMSSIVWGKIIYPL